MIHDLYIASCAHHPKSNHFPSPYIWSPYTLTKPTPSRLVTTIHFFVIFSITIYLPYTLLTSTSPPPPLPSPHFCHKANRIRPPSVQSVMLGSQPSPPTSSTLTPAATEASAKLNPELWMELENLWLMQVSQVKKTLIFLIHPFFLQIFCKDPNPLSLETICLWSNKRQRTLFIWNTFSVTVPEGMGSNNGLPYSLRVLSEVFMGQNRNKNISW